MAFRPLEYLVAVAQERHFARAAEKCFVSQPALSAAIAKLEREFDAPLINRGRAFEGLTPQGERLVGWARRMLAEYSALQAEVRATRAEMTGLLRLGAVPAADTTASLLVSEFCSAHPLVRVDVRSRFTATDLYRQLRRFEVDAAIVPVGAHDWRDLDMAPLYEDRYVLISAEAMMPSRTSKLRWPDAAELPLALLTSDRCARDVIDAAFAEHGITMTPRMEIDSAASLLAQVATGEWVSIVPRIWLEGTARSDDIRAVDLVDPVLKLQLAVATNRAGPASPVAKAFVACTQQLRLRRNGFQDCSSDIRDIHLVSESDAAPSESTYVIDTDAANNEPYKCRGTTDDLLRKLG